MGISFECNWSSDDVSCQFQHKYSWGDRAKNRLLRSAFSIHFFFNTFYKLQYIIFDVFNVQHKGTPQSLYNNLGI